MKTLLFSGWKENIKDILGLVFMALLLLAMAFIFG